MKVKSTFYQKKKFLKIMAFDDISVLSILKSFDIDENIGTKTFCTKEGSGKSGSFFYVTYDKKFIIKTLRREEKDVLINMLDDFIDHLKNVKDLKL